MLRSVAVQRIKDGLGFRPDLDDKIILRLQEEQRALEQGATLPWFLVEEDALVSVLSGNRSVALPERFLRPYDAEGMRYLSQTKPTLQMVVRKELNEALAAYTDSDPTGPKVFSLRSNSLYFLPTPDQGYTLTWSYYKGAELLTTDIENKWLQYAPEVLIGGAGVRMAKDTRDKDAITIFSDMQKEGAARLFREIIAREEAARYRRKGGAL